MRQSSKETKIDKDDRYRAVVVVDAGTVHEVKLDCKHLHRSYRAADKCGKKLSEERAEWDGYQVETLPPAIFVEQE